jgi:hypothetical protein
MRVDWRCGNKTMGRIRAAVMAILAMLLISAIGYFAGVHLFEGY